MIKKLAIDTEHSEGVYHPWEDGFYLTCVGLVSNTGVREVVWFEHEQQLPTLYGLPRIQELINTHDLIIGHNLKHDLNILRYMGVEFDNQKLHCTMVVDYLHSGHDPDKRLDLSSVAERHGLEPKLDKVAAMWDAGIATKEVPPELLQEYVLDDAQKTFDVANLQEAVTKAQSQTALCKLQNEFIFLLSDMELNGFKWDQKKAEEIIDENRQKLIRLEEQLLEITEVPPESNLSSPIHLSGILFGGSIPISTSQWEVRTLKSKPESKYVEVKTTEDVYCPGIWKPDPRNETKRRGVYSTDKNVIKHLRCRTRQQRMVKSLLLERSRIRKLLDTFRGSGKGTGICRKVRADDLVHPKFNNARTRTGRLSSSDPNGQNLPRGNTSPIKSCIVPRYDGILQIDHSQMEWRCAAQLSKDPIMIKEINNGIDQHAKACTDLMEMELTKENRTHAKVFNFRMIYGGGHYGYYLDPDMPNFSKTKWKNIVEAFAQKYAGLAQYNETNVAKVWKAGGTLTIPTGRRFKFILGSDKEGGKEFNIRQIKNYPVQGIAGGDLVPLHAIILRRAFKKYKLKSLFILTVHDSLVIDYLDEELELILKIVKEVTENFRSYIKNFFGFEWVTRLDVEAEAGPDYGDLKPIMEVGA